MILFDLGYLVLLILSLPFWIKALFKREYRKILKNRFSPQIEPAKKKRIWIHAVSVGEVKSLKNLVERLSASSDREIVLSVTTPSGYAFARDEYRDIRVINAPIDLSFTVRHFIKKIDPQVLILNELEIWPNWTLLTRKAGVPILLINGRISDRAFKRYLFFKPLLAKLLGKIELFMVQSDMYKERFTQLHIPPQKIVVCGNIKADTAAVAAGSLPPDAEILEHLKIKKNSRKLLTLASTHESDEKALFPHLKKISRDYAVIIVPRHIDRVEIIEKNLAERGISFSRWTSTGKIDLGKQVLIFDSIGYLFNILKISDIVFMGGTFERKIGGHNLYEPAALGKLIVGGPHYNNFPDIGRELSSSGVYRGMSSPSKLERFLLDNGKPDFEKVSEQAVTAVSRRRGSVECILREVRKRIG